MREATALKALGLLEFSLVLFSSSVLRWPMAAGCGGKALSRCPPQPLTPDVFGLINCAGKTNLGL